MPAFAWDFILLLAIGGVIGLSVKAQGRGRPSWLDFNALALPLVAWLCAGAAAVSGEAPWQPLACVAGAATWVALWRLITGVWRPVRGLRAGAILLAAAALHYGGVRIGLVKLPFAPAYLALRWYWSLPVAAFWMWLCAGLFARAGSIPGLAYGVGTVAWFALLAVCWLQPTVTGPAVTFLAQGVAAACLCVVLARFRSPFAARTAGAYVLGFLFGAASIMGMLKNTTFLAAVLPLLLLSVPILGATYSYAVDLRRGRRRLALTQQRLHLYELLLAQGYSPVQVAALLTAGAAWCGALAVLLVLLIKLHFALKLLIAVGWLAAGLVLGYIVLRLLPRPQTIHPESIRLLGVRITPLSMEEALDKARGFLAEDHPHMIVTSDATGVVAAHDDAEFREIMDQADMVTADGQGVVLAARLLDLPIRERVSGVDMVQRLCEVAAEAGRSVFLLGAAEGVAEAAAEQLRAVVPGLEIAGTRDGYFAPEEEPALIAHIRDLRPAVLFVAFGIPKQEKWIRAHMEELGVPVCIGVGGSFDVISGRLKRAPEWMRKWGLEWLFRVTQEPQRLPRLKALPRMAWLALCALARGGGPDAEPEMAKDEC